MKPAALKAEQLTLAAHSLLAGAQRTEVLRRLGHHILEEFHLYSAGGLRADGDVKVHLRVLCVHRVEGNFALNQNVGTTEHCDCLYGE